MASDWDGTTEDEKYYFNSATGQVEHGKLSNALDRVGPFDTREEAERAPQIIRERAEEWAREEAAEDD